MSRSQKPSIPYKQLKQENKVLGNIISALKANKHDLEIQNDKLQHHIHQISTQQATIRSENQELRNITAQLQQKLHTFCSKNQISQSLQPTQLEYNQNKSTNNSKRELLQFLTDTSNRINNIESKISLDAKPENNIHCLQQKINKLEIDKTDLLKCNQHCTAQLQEIINDQDSLQQKLCYLENENMKLREQLIEKNASDNTSTNSKENLKQRKTNKCLSNLSFEDVIKQVKLIEDRCEHQEDLKLQVDLLTDENQKLREQLIEKQNENQSLLYKYNDTLKHCELLGEKVFKIK